MNSARMYVCVCVCVCSKYDGPSVPWDDVPDVPRDGVRRSTHIGPPERRHLQPEPRPTPATACDCRLRYVKCLLCACLPKVYVPSFKHLFLFVCACVSLLTLSVLLCAASIWHGFCNSVLSVRSALLLCLWCVNSAA